MNVTNKVPRYNEEVHLDLISKGWTPLKEPKNMINTILLSIPFMFLNAIISIGLIKLFSDITFAEYGITPELIIIDIKIDIIFFMILLVIFHELIHVILLPNFIKSKNTYLGITWVGAFVISEEIISKTRYILITLAPFFLISIVLPIILALFEMLDSTFKFLIILNAVGSSVDLLVFFIIAFQVPKKGIIKNNGDRTYWKYKSVEPCE